ncbi:MAG: hypothetical protein ACRD20_19500 [Terriglobales bacterium]
MHYVALFDFRLFAEAYLSERPDHRFCTLLEIRPDYGQPGRVKNAVDRNTSDREREPRHAR